MIFQIFSGDTIHGYLKAKNKDAAIHKAAKRGFTERNLCEMSSESAWDQWQDMMWTLTELQQLTEELAGVLRMEGLL